MMGKSSNQSIRPASLCSFHKMQLDSSSQHLRSYNSLMKRESWTTLILIVNSINYCEQ